jgi:hypothetical protein
MRTIFRWAFRLFLVCLVLLIAGILLLDTIAREMLEYRLRNETGLEAKIGKVHIGLLHPEFTIENLILYNSADFGGSPLIDMPELHVEYDRDALWSRKVHCRLIRFNLAEINLVDDKKGRRNVDVLQKRLESAGVGLPGKKNSAGGFSKSLDFTGIDTLNLTLGRLTHFDMKQPGKVDEFRINTRHQVFTNIKSDKDFSGAMLVALLRSGVDVNQSWIQLSQSLLQLFAPPKK